MVKGGKLSLVEKAAIQGMLGQQKSTEEIASLLDRSEKIVENYIDGELDQLHSTIAEAQLEAEENKDHRYSKAKKKDIFHIRDVDKVDAQEVTDEKTIATVNRRLSQAGLKDNDITKVLELAITRFAKLGRKFKDDNELYTECIRQMKAGEFMIKKSQGGRDGVAIMTPAASQKMDDSSKRNNYSRYSEKNIYKPFG
jgi:hypothetical protein